MEETQRSEEQKFRMNFKLSATQKWHGEFTVRANTEEELKANLESVHKLFIEELATLRSVGGGINE